MMGALCRVVLACLLAACSREHEPVGHAHGPPRPSRPAEPHHDEHEGERSEHAAGSEVHIDPGMLRDLRVTLQAAESRPAGDAVAVLGELEVSDDAYAELASPIAARVSRVLVAAGDRVVARQPLAELSSADVGRARAALRSAEASRAVARQAFERKSALAKDQIVSERELESSRAELLRAEAEVAAGRDTLEAIGAARGNGSSFVLATPIAGTVIERSAWLGRLADPQAALFIVGDLSRLWLVAHAFERDALRLRVPSAARVTFPALPGQVENGTVTRIGSRVDPTSRTVDVRIELDNPRGVLRPGMSASALVRLGDSSEQVIAVPVEALSRSADGWCVFLPTAAAGVFELRPVARGRDLGGEVEILSGLAAGERVVKDGAFLLAAEAEKARGGGDEHHH